jgi:hypothetical protein
MYRSATMLFALVMIGLGLVLLTETVVHGFGVGVLLGLLFVAAGVGRIVMIRRRT